MDKAEIESENGGWEYYAVRSVIEHRENQNPLFVGSEIVGKLHASSAKKVVPPTDRGDKKPLPSKIAKHYKYSIADFLSNVKGVFDDTFSNDVYSRLGSSRKQRDFSSHLRHSIDLDAYTRERDADYMNAVENGDMETAQRMVDEAAKKAMPNSKLVLEDGNLRKVYHGTNTGGFYVFNPDYIGMSSGDEALRLMETGTITNEDAGWEIFVGTKGKNDTVSHSGKEKASVKMLSEIKSIVQNAVLLDTQVPTKNNKSKHDLTAFMHKFYAPVVYNGKPYIAKVSVEEYGTSKNKGRRFYNLRGMKIDPAGDTPNAKASYGAVPDTGSITISISDLFSFVKTFDENFHPKAVSPMVLNEDGTPKVFYHGTNAEFDAFSSEELSYREGSFFYSMVKVKDRFYLAKLSVDELDADSTTIRRAYNVNNIEISPVAVTRDFSPAGTTDDIGDIVSINSVSDLFSFVKTHDEEFSPKPVSPMVLNEDGTPKILYHQTSEEFAEL